MDAETAPTMNYSSGAVDAMDAHAGVKGPGAGAGGFPRGWRRCRCRWIWS